MRCVCVCGTRIPRPCLGEEGRPIQERSRCRGGQRKFFFMGAEPTLTLAIQH